MTVIFPEKLPYPTTEGYAIKPGEAIVRTDMLIFWGDNERDF